MRTTGSSWANPAPGLLHALATVPLPDLGRALPQHPSRVVAPHRGQWLVCFWAPTRRSPNRHTPCPISLALPCGPGPAPGTLLPPALVAALPTSPPLPPPWGGHWAAPFLCAACSPRTLVVRTMPPCAWHANGCRFSCCCCVSCIVVVRQGWRASVGVLHVDACHAHMGGVAAHGSCSHACGGRLMTGAPSGGACNPHPWRKVAPNLGRNRRGGLRGGGQGWRCQGEAAGRDEWG